MKQISEMSLKEIQNEIVELQCKQVAYEWDDAAPAFTHNDWTRLLALRQAYYDFLNEYEIVDL